MQQRKKIILIGAGSASFTQGLVADLILTGKPWQLGLVDINPEALQTAEGLTRRMIQLKEADIQMEASTDRRDLLPGADVVVTTISVGGRRAWEADVFIPRTYGIYQPVGDTVMPGGISRALRMVPALVEIAKDLLQLCPQAYFFNYANPMTVNCWALHKATGINVVGLCHGVHDVQRELAHFLGVPPNEMTALAVGVNHFTWIYDLRWQGEDAWPLVRARIAEERGQTVADPQLRQKLHSLGSKAAGAPMAAHNPFAWSLFERYGAYPAVNDRHVVEFFPERFPQGSYYGKQLGVDAFSFEGTIAGGDQQMAAMQARAAGAEAVDEKYFHRAEGEHEQLIEILAALQHDTRQLFSVNLPNRGAVAALPAEAVLELPAVATARGFHALQVSDLPAPLLAPLQRRLAAHALTVEAALSGSRSLFVEALLADGAVSDAATAGKLADELLHAQAAHLPQFA
jgi:alpha-galactosidase